MKGTRTLLYTGAHLGSPVESDLGLGCASDSDFQPYNTIPTVGLYGQKLIEVFNSDLISAKKTQDPLWGVAARSSIACKKNHRTIANQ